MNTHETYVSLEVAKLLKETGFDWECNHCFHLEVFKELETPYRNHNSGLDVYGYDNRGQYMSAPTISVAQKWLREVKGYELWVYPFSTHYRFSFYGYLANEDNNTNFDTYEEALEAGIRDCLINLVSKRK